MYCEGFCIIVKFIDFYDICFYDFILIIIYIFIFK